VVDGGVLCNERAVAARNLCPRTLERIGALFRLLLLLVGFLSFPWPPPPPQQTPGPETRETASPAEGGPPIDRLPRNGAVCMVMGGDVTAR
jgi:hypothetical protein